MATQRKVRRRLSHIHAPTMKRSKKLHSMSATERLKSRLTRRSREAAKSLADKKIDEQRRRIVVGRRSATHKLMTVEALKAGWSLAKKVKKPIKRLVHLTKKLPITKALKHTAKGVAKKAIDPKVWDASIVGGVTVGALGAGAAIAHQVHKGWHKKKHPTVYDKR